MACVLRAGGPDFPVDDFLSKSSFEPLAVFRAKERRTTGRGEPRSGFNLLVSSADFEIIPSQVEEAIEFLKRNHTELKRLVAFQGLETVELDFGIALRDVAAQTERFPYQLLGLLGNLRIQLAFTLYPTGEQERGQS